MDDFTAIFDRHFDAVHAYLQRQVGRGLADELAGETFLVVFDNRARYDSERAGAGMIDTTVYCYDRPALDGNLAILGGADPIATCAKLWRNGEIGSSRSP